MKLTKGKLIDTLRRKNDGWTTYQARKIAGISIRRVNQVYKQYALTGEIPEIGKNNGRPIKPIENWEIQMVKQSYEKYRVSAWSIKHPQSNGKVEKWFDVYRLHRHAFKTKEEFLCWYNEVRPHRSLKFEELETPQQAFVRKMKAEI